MIPPDEFDVIDRHGGYTIESKMPWYLRMGRFENRRELPDRAFRPSVNAATKDVARQRAREKLLIGDTLWRRAKRDLGGTLREARLLDYDEHSFYQTNDDVTQALYRVRGYGYPIVVWFDNQTGERIA